jgi:hypothetical protein
VQWLPPLSSTGEYKAPSDPEPQTFIALARATVASPAPALLVAGAHVSVNAKQPDPCAYPTRSLWRLIVLVGIVGALGGLTHALGSFGTYVGNRELKASWIWWYALKPLLSATVAIIVFFVFRAGLGAPDLGLAATDCLKVAGFAGLVGLFAEPATLKLKDIFDTLFTPRRDPRDDKAGEGGSAAKPAVPEIEKVEPEEIEGGKAAHLRLTGKRFAERCAVRIGSTTFKPKWNSPTSLELDIEANKLGPGSHDVVVINTPPSSDASKADKLTVK